MASQRTPDADRAGPPETAPTRTTEPASPERCAWCGERFGAGDRRLAGRIRCARCGAATTDPWPTEDVLAAAYARYRPESGRFSGPGDAILSRSRARLAERIDALAPPGRVLDVGSGDGTLLDALAARGRDAVGLERSSTRPDVREGEVEDLDGSFAAIVLWHSLEHLARPGATVEAAASLLEPGGILVIAVPNAGSLQAAAFGDRWFHLDLPRHLVHLPAAALTARLPALGLDVVRVSHWRAGQMLFGWLHGLVGSLPGRPDLYDAIRTPEARMRPLGPARRAATLAAGVALAPVAAVMTAAEIVLRRGGTVEVEARRV